MRASAGTFIGDRDTNHLKGLATRGDADPKVDIAAVVCPLHGGPAVERKGSGRTSRSCPALFPFSYTYPLSIHTVSYRLPQS